MHSQGYNFGQTLLAANASLRKRDRTRSVIQNAGCTLLDRNALADLTVSAICREANIAHGTFYIYFPDRQAFVADLLNRFVDHIQIVMQQASRAGGADAVRATTEAYYLMFEQNPGIMKCLVHHLEEFPKARDAFQTLNREWAATVVSSTELKLAQSGRGGALSRDELFRRAYALGGMVDQYLAALLLSHDRTLAGVSADKAAVIETLTHIWKRGMAE